MIAEKNGSRHLPGEEGIWVFIFGDMMIFGLFFATFVFYRSQNLELYLDSRSTLNVHYGAVNTVLLLTSSLFVALGLHSVRKQLQGLPPLLFSAGWVCGAGFFLVKIIEYGEKIRAGITVMTNEFYMFYYMYTGIHFLHVIIGLVVLMFLLGKSRQSSFTARDIRTFESGAAYWHMVDLLWIILFPLLYLMT